MEIERKFLILDDSYKQLAVSHSEILQGYLCSGHGRTVRVRLRDDRGYLTIKGPSADGGISRFEWEREISADDARALFALCEPGRIHKTRWLVPSGSHTVEVDEFHDDNQGLLFAEIELRDPDEPYLAPPFLGPEVTGDGHFSNAYIASHPYRTWPTGYLAALLARE